MKSETQIPPKESVISHTRMRS